MLHKITRFFEPLWKLCLKRSCLRASLGLGILICLWLTGCEKDTPEFSSYEPSSPLPLRVGEIYLTPTPESEVLQELSSQVFFEDTPTPEPEPIAITPSSAPTVSLSKKSDPVSMPTVNGSKGDKPVSATPTLQTTPTPQSTPSPHPENTPTPAVQPASAPVEADTAKPTATPSLLVQQKEQVDETPEEEHDPIMTPYNITIDKLLVCANVQDRKPIDCGENFSLAETGKVFTWMKVSEVNAPKTIKHVYYQGDVLIATVKLPLKYTSMRTWSQKTFKRDHTGTWKVVVMTEDDQVLATRTWTMTP